MDVCSWVGIKAAHNGLDQGLKQPVMDTVLNYSGSILGYRLCKFRVVRWHPHCRPVMQEARFWSKSVIPATGVVQTGKAPFSVCWWWARSSRIVQEMGLLLTLPLFSREGKTSTAAALFGTAASAKERETRSGEILVRSPTSSVGLPQLCIPII